MPQAIEDGTEKNLFDSTNQHSVKYQVRQLNKKNK